MPIWPKSILRRNSSCRIQNILRPRGPDKFRDRAIFFQRSDASKPGGTGLDRFAIHLRPPGVILMPAFGLEGDRLLAIVVEQDLAADDLADPVGFTIRIEHPSDPQAVLASGTGGRRSRRCLGLRFGRRLLVNQGQRNQWRVQVATPSRSAPYLGSGNDLSDGAASPPDSNGAWSWR